MLFFAFIGLIIGLQHCSVVVENIDNVEKAEDIMYLGCDNILARNISSASAGTEPFFTIPFIDSNDGMANITFVDCNFSQSGCVAANDYPFSSVNLTIVNTDIGRGIGFTRNGVIMSPTKTTLVDCVINTTQVSQTDGGLTVSNITFINCVFVGKFILDKYVMRLSYNDEVKDFNIEFIDCRFDIDDESDGLEEGEVGFFMRVEDTDRVTANISFVRCYSERNSSKPLKMVRAIFNEEEARRRISVVGEDNGISIEWGFVDDYKFQYDDVGWEEVVNDTGYYPIPATSNTIPDENDGDGSEGGSKESDKKKVDQVWLIIAIVFIVLFVIAVAVMVILLFITKKKYDRSENE